MFAAAGGQRLPEKTALRAGSLANINCSCNTCSDGELLPPVVRAHMEEHHEDIVKG